MNLNGKIDGKNGKIDRQIDRFLFPTERFMQLNVRKKTKVVGTQSHLMFYLT